MELKQSSRDVAVTSVRRRPPAPTDLMRVLRIYHSGVVSIWRARERELERLGVDVTLVSASSWNEGGAEVPLEADGDAFVTPCATIGRHPFLFVYNPITLWRVMRRGPFDIIDAHEEPASIAHAEIRLVAGLTGQRRTPMVFYGAQNIPKRYPIPFRWFESRAFRRCAGTYVCSGAAGDNFVAKGFGGAVRVIGLGIDTDLFRPGTRRRDGEPLRVGYVGRLEEYKGVHLVIEALASSDHELHVYGDGPYRSTLASLAARHLTKVAFHGHTRSVDLPEIYRSLDVVVVPSQTRPNWMEQFGRVAVEAMACGVPVIVSDSGSLPELVGDAGVVVAEADPVAWRAAIDELAADVDARSRRSEAGVEHAAQYAWSAIARQQLQLYEVALGV